MLPPSAPSTIFLRDLNYTCANGEVPNYRNVLAIEGSQNHLAPVFQGSLYIKDKTGFSAGVACMQASEFGTLPNGESIAGGGGTFHAVWTTSNGRPRMQEGFTFNTEMHAVNNVDCATGTCGGGFVFTINTCVAFHFSLDTDVDMTLGASADWQILRTSGASTYIYEILPPNCPEPIPTCTIVGSNTCEWVTSTFGYYEDYLLYDPTNVDNSDNSMLWTNYFGEYALHGDGYCDTDICTARWAIWGTDGGSSGYFVCPDHLNGVCHNTDLGDCCNSPGLVGDPCSISPGYTPPNCGASLGVGIELPLSSAQWLGLMRNESISEIVVPARVSAQLAGIVANEVVPVSASSPGFSALVTGDSGKICYQTSATTTEAMQCSMIIESGACLQSYKSLLGGAVVSPCLWQNNACERSASVYRRCK